MQSTLFLNNLSCVDHAYINDLGYIVGGSYHPNIEVTGEVEAVENVVVDFSKVKKELKALIDDNENGFDHKLWVMPGFSMTPLLVDAGETIRIETPHVELDMPRNAVKIFDFRCNGDFMETLHAEFNAYLTAGLSALHPDLNITVRSTMTTNAFTQERHQAVMFRYFHGLKNSSSWGCQNHSHGHLSFIEYEFAAGRGIGKAICELVEDLDNTLFIFKDNVTEEDDDVIAIEYTTKRGWFYAKYKKARMKIVVLDTETTIEHIADWFVNMNREVLAENGVTRVMVSEGLAKGAVVVL